MDFKTMLYNSISESIKNNFMDNWDFYRYGEESTQKSISPSQIFKNFLKVQLAQISVINKHLSTRYMNAYNTTIDSFSYLYENLEDEKSREILINVLTYRLLGHKKVKINAGELDYFAEMEKIEKKFDPNDYILPDGFRIKHSKIDLTEMGYPITMYLSSLGIFYDFVYKQYELKRPDICIKVEEGDTVIDGGGCFGDTALYFSFLAGQTGKVFSFEFIPSNIRLFRQNADLNPNICSNISLVPFPLWDESDINIYYKDNGPGSIVNLDANFDFEGITQTISLDDYVKRYNIGKVDFIKLDIEGAEFNALQGAKSTIIRNKPKLAIALYHSIEDFDRIPRFLKTINPNYKFYFHHATINKEESVLFAV